MKSLKGKKVAILTETGFEEVELTSPMQALEQAGAEVHIVSPQFITSISPQAKQKLFIAA